MTIDDVQGAMTAGDEGPGDISGIEDSGPDSIAPDTRAEVLGGDADAHWRDTIQDGRLRHHAERFTSVDALVKAHMDLRSRLSTAVVPPGRDAAPEDVAAYRQKIGVPDTPYDYQYETPEGFEPTDNDLDYRERMFDLMHRHNVPADAVSEIAAEHIQHMRESAEALARAEAEADTAYLQTAEATLRKEWGRDYDANVQYAQEWEERVAGGQLGELELKNGQLLGSHPLFLKIAAEAGRTFGEGDIHIGTGADTGGTLTERANHARQMREEARRSGNHSEARRWDKEERRILGRMPGR